MPLILAGVIADKDPAKGQAIIGRLGCPANSIAVGAMIPGGARLHAVYGDRVLLERNGRARDADAAAHADEGRPDYHAGAGRGHAGG